MVSPVFYACFHRNPYDLSYECGSLIVFLRLTLKNGKSAKLAVLRAHNRADGTAKIRESRKISGPAGAIRAAGDRDNQEESQT